MMRLHISCPTGKQVEVVAGPDDSVAELKAALDEREGTASRIERLHSCGTRRRSQRQFVRWRRTQKS